MTGTITPELVNKVTNGSVQDLTVAGSLVAAATFDDNGAFTSINFDLKDLEASFKLQHSILIKASAYYTTQTSLYCR